jgi:transcriptional regulator with XRE-family HTH domain
MTTISLDDFLHEIGLEGDARVAKAVEEIRSTLPLAALRTAAKKTQAQLAEALTISQAAVSKFEGRGDFLLSTLCKYAKALSARVELSVHLSEATFDLTPYDDEGQMCFRLAKRHTKKAATVSMLSSIRLRNEIKEHRGCIREYMPDWGRFRSNDYASAPSITSELAANDEAQPLAA